MNGEGITKQARHYEGATIRDVVDLYIDELVKRNMVISERDMVTSRYEFCQLHDLMREVCLLKAEEENFLQIVSDRTCSSSVHSQASTHSRRLVVYIGTTDQAAKKMIKNPKLRSLLFFPVKFDWFPRGLYYMEFQFLRVLDLTRANFEGWKLPSNIGKLIHLKYLSLYKTYVAHLPSSIRNLKSLLYLNLDFSYGKCHVPNVLKEMQELRYLCLPRFTHRRTKLELGGLLKLETLWNFSTMDSSVTDLDHMTRLRSLSISIERCTVEVLSSISKLRDLENLTMIVRNDKKGSVLDCVHLKKPDVQHFPSHLTTIYLDGCLWVEDPMPILEKLLQLKVVYLGRNAYVGRRMVCSSSGFPQLQEVKLFGLDEWEEWIVEEGSMPLLQTLTIEFCPKLKKLPAGQRLNFPKLHTLSIQRLYELEEWIIEEGSMPRLHTLIISYCKNLQVLPDGLPFFTSLKELTIATNDREIQKKVSKGGEDYYKIQHIPLIQYNFPPE